MQVFCNQMLQFAEIKEILARIRAAECPVAVGGLSSVHKAHLISVLRIKTGRPVIVLCPDENEAGKLSEDIAAFTGEAAYNFCGRDFTFFPVETVSRKGEHARLAVLYRLLGGNPPVVCAAADAFMQRTLPPDVLLRQAVTLTPNLEMPSSELVKLLVTGGYKRCMQVEGAGQFSQRGGIIDFFSPFYTSPVRIEYFGDEIDTVSFIDPSTQRRTENIDQAVVLPCAETLPHTADGGIESLAKAIDKLSGDNSDGDKLRETGSLADIDRYMALISKRATALDYIPKNAIVFITEQARLNERISNFLWQRNSDVTYLLEQKRLTSKTADLGADDGDFWHAVSKYDTIMLDNFLASNYNLRPHAIMNIAAKQLPSFGVSLDTAVSDAAHYYNKKYTVAVLVPNERRAENLVQILRNRNLPASVSSEPIQGQITVMTGSISAGIEYPALALAILTEGQLSFEKKKKVSGVKESSRKRIASYTDLTPGDLVVHEHHGIALFTGLETMTVDGVRRDYIKLAFAGTDMLYLPVTQLNLVSKYIGAGSEQGEIKTKKLNKLGGTEWQKSKSRAKAAAKELAKELIQLYAVRKRKEGFAFPSDCDWQMSFEESFSYEETDDQLKCIQEIKTDMQESCPMDRLLCGDVGFGKTEVALRAVMKCILGGKQAAILVPTTVLAQQHYQTALQRFSGFPVRVAVLSRFRSPAQIKDALARLRSGKLDLVIGTHRLLQKDVQFKNLGLLIVDEEQRFGVTHKERLKEMSTMVDSLTLTATPIPRTLNMALSGIRDMSTIEEAPLDRYPVQTFVLEHNWQIIIDAIRREVNRGGQVYYLHNRVETIDRVASQIIEMLPDATIAVGHGQMNERELSEVMRKTTEGEAQVLICTTIIETGIDIPNVNTLIVEDADKMGLSQLHQLRGRVGRSSRHAYAYLTYKKGKILSEISTKRLSAIREFAEFGSGFKIAMRDLEIRGAGNVLGSQQSGHMMSVGYDMYLKLLEEAVIEEKGEASSAVVECVVDFLVSASIPEKYIPHAGIRIDIYRRIAAVTTQADAQDVIDELIDRFGDVPDSVSTLTQIALLRTKAGRAGISELSQKGDRLMVKMAVTDFALIAKICSMPQYKGRTLFFAGDSPYISIKLVNKEPILKAGFEFVEAVVDILQ